MKTYTGTHDRLHARYQNSFDKLFLDDSTESSVVLFDDITSEDGYRAWEAFNAAFMLALRNALAYQDKTTRHIPHLTADSFTDIPVNQRYKANYLSYELPVSVLWVRVSEHQLLLLGKDILSGQCAYGEFDIVNSTAVCGTNFSQMPQTIGSAALFDFYFPVLPT